MAEHVDVRTLVRAPLPVVWAAANDPEVWARAGHPVQDLVVDGDRISFTVTTPLDERGRTSSYQVERVADEAGRTVYSRRLSSPDFRYSHVWFAYSVVGAATEMRCVVDFEMAPDAATSDGDMAALLEGGLRRNLIATADQIETTERMRANG